VNFHAGFVEITLVLSLASSRIGCFARVEEWSRELKEEEEIEEEEGEERGERGCRVSHTVRMTVNSIVSWSKRRGRRGDILYRR